MFDSEEREWHHQQISKNIRNWYISKNLNGKKRVPFSGRIQNEFRLGNDANLYLGWQMRVENIQNNIHVGIHEKNN